MNSTSETPIDVGHRWPSGVRSAISGAVGMTTGLLCATDPGVVVLFADVVPAGSPGLSWAVAVLLLAAVVAQSVVLLLLESRPRVCLSFSAVIAVGFPLVIGFPSLVLPLSVSVAVTLFVLSARGQVRGSFAAVAVVLAVLSSSQIVWWEATHNAATLPGPAPILVPRWVGAAAVWWGACVLGAALRSVIVHSRRQEPDDKWGTGIEHRVLIARAQERERIAQELHDVTSQHVFGLLALADAAHALRASDPELALDMVEEVRVEGRFAVAGLYGAVEELRTGTATTPTPDLRQLGVLADQWSRRGMSIAHQTVGDVASLPAVVSTTLYRVAQEAVANAAKHASGAHVHLHVHVGHTAAELTVDNDEAGSPVDMAGKVLGLGWGIAGATQRLAVLQGTFEAGPSPHGGWRVRARAPLGVSVVLGV